MSEDIVAGLDWVWEIKKRGRLPKGIKFHFKVIGEEEVEVPAGKFKATKIKVIEKVDDVQAGKRDYWYAQGVGIVKEFEERYSEKGELLTKESELLEFDLAPAKEAKKVVNPEKEELVK